MKQLIVTLAFAISLALPVSAQDFGKGVDAYLAGDYATAIKEFTPLAAAGNVAAQSNLGLMYANGQGVSQDYTEAVKWYRLAAEQGDATAQSNLGVMYENGYGVLQDNVMAHMWYNIGAANGYKIGGTNPDSLSKQMTPADISKAQAMARECMNSGYKKCEY
ncbi:sel1 repeat family protein [Ascidiaceihabitans sp.]|nr:sel1 repeat family protein [Ascidiaceihabitans sp.]